MIRFVTAYTCAICQRVVPYAGSLPELYPFCSVRCRSVDLWKWFREQYAIDRALSPEELPGATPRDGRDESA